MKAALDAWFGKFDALAVRERRLIALAVIGGIVLVGGSLFIDPAYMRWRNAERGIAEQRAQLQVLQAQAIVLQSPAQDPEVRARGELDALKAQLGRLNERLATMESALVPPQQMSGLLEELIGQRSGLHLLSLHTVAVAPVLDKGAADPAGKREGPGGLYKHGVEIKLEGSYAELTDYLSRLEKSSRKLLWSSASLSTERHPRLVLTVTVYTLSLDKTWLVV